MKKNYMLNIVVGFIMLFSVSSLYAVDTTLPKGKPFVQINDEIVEVQGTVSNLQAEIDTLIASVSTIEEQQAILQAELDLAKEDVATNADKIAALETKLENIKNLISVKNNIATGTCPEGQAVVAVAENSILCKKVNPEMNVYRLSKYVLLKANERTGFTIFCTKNGDYAINAGYGTTPMAPVFNFQPGNHNGWSYGVENQHYNPILFSGILNCVDGGWIPNY